MVNNIHVGSALQALVVGLTDPRTIEEKLNQSGNVSTNLNSTLSYRPGLQNPGIPGRG